MLLPSGLDLRLRSVKSSERKCGTFFSYTNQTGCCRLSGRMDQSPQDIPGPSSVTASAAAGTPQQLIDQLTQLIGVLQKARGVLPGFDELLARQRAQEQLTQQQHGAQKLQQEQIEKWVAQELLVTQLTQQLGVYAQALEQLQGICQQQELRVGAVQAHTAHLQQQLGQKHKRIEGLELDSAAKDKHIQDLEVRLHKYRKLCSYVTTSSQVGHTQRSYTAAKPPPATPVAMHLMIHKAVWHLTPRSPIFLYQSDKH